MGKTVGEVYEQSAEEDNLSDLMKVLSSIYARHLALVGHAPHPHFLIASKYLNIYLTNACNLHCVHCFMNAGAKLKSELTSEKWKEVLSEFYAEGGEYVTFTGGEPTMYPQFEEVVMFAHQIGLKVTVLSNGLLWSEEKIQRIKSYLDEMQLV